MARTARVRTMERAGLVDSEAIKRHMPYLSAIMVTVLASGFSGLLLAQDPYCDWEVKAAAIEKPLCGLAGDARRGRAIAGDTHQGNCLACHQLPIPEEGFHGTIGPPLANVGSRLSAAQLRLRIVDEQLVNPNTIMPPFYRQPEKLNRVAVELLGKTFLTAQQVEDLVAYLSSLREASSQ